MNEKNRELKIKKYKKEFENLKNYVEERVSLINDLSRYSESFIPALHVLKYQNTNYERQGEVLERDSVYNMQSNEIDINNKFPLVTVLVDKYLSDTDVDYDALSDVFKSFTKNFLIDDWNDFPIEKLIKKHKDFPDRLRFLKSLNFKRKISIEQDVSEYGYKEIKLMKDYLSDSSVEVLVEKSLNRIVKDLKEENTLASFTKVLIDESFNVPEHVDKGWRSSIQVNYDNKVIAENSFKFIGKQDSLENYLFRIMYNRMYEYKDIVKHVKDSFDKKLDIGVFQSFCIENNFLFNEEKNFEALKINIKEDSDFNVSIIFQDSKKEVNLELKFKNLNELDNKIGGNLKNIALCKLVEENNFRELIKDDLIDASTLTSKLKNNENRYYTLAEYIEVMENSNQKTIKKVKGVLSNNDFVKQNKSLVDYLRTNCSPDEVFNNLDEVHKKLFNINDVEKIKEKFMLNKYLVSLESNLNEKVQKSAISGIDYSGRELSNFIPGGISSIRQNLKNFGDLSESEKDMLYALAYEAIDKQIEVNNVFSLLFTENNKDEYVMNSTFEKEVIEKMIAADLIELNKFFKLFAKFNEKENEKELGKLFNEYNNSDYHYKSISHQNIVQTINFNANKHLDSVVILSKFMKKNKELAIYNLDNLTNLYNSFASLIESPELLEFDNSGGAKNLEEIEANLLEVIIYAESKDVSKPTKRIKQKF